MEAMDLIERGLTLMAKFILIGVTVMLWPLLMYTGDASNMFKEAWEM